MFRETPANNEWSLQTERALLKLIYFVQNMKFLHKYQHYLDTILMFPLISVKENFLRNAARTNAALCHMVQSGSRNKTIHTASVIEMNRIICIRNHIINCLFISTLAHYVYLLYLHNEWWIGLICDPNWCPKQLDMKHGYFKISISFLMQVYSSYETFPEKKNKRYIKNVAADGLICMCACNHRAIVYL